MSEPIQPKQRPVVRALRTAMKTFSDQALALDLIFSRTAKEASPGGMRFHDDMRLALKAQAQYRATLKILLALAAEEKSRNSRKRTIGDGNSVA